jgi:hypothetical protein
LASLATTRNWCVCWAKRAAATLLLTIVETIWRGCSGGTAACCQPRCLTGCVGDGPPTGGEVAIRGHELPLAGRASKAGMLWDVVEAGQRSVVEQVP